MIFTKITSSIPKSLSKSFSLSNDGTLQKQSAGQLVEGAFNVVNCHSITEFSKLLPTLNNNQALCYGRPVKGSGHLLSKKLKAERQNEEAITRTKQDFDWPKGAAVFFGDYDPQPDTTPLSPEQLRSILCIVFSIAAQQSHLLLIFPLSVCWYTLHLP